MQEVFKSTQPPVVVDEIQYALNLFKYIKMIADETGKKGLFYLTGSQQFRMMKGVSESLAGRISIINLLGLSLREIFCIDFNKPFIPTDDYFIERGNKIQNKDYKQIWQIIWKGSMPTMHAEDADWQLFYSAYTKTYIERDVRELTQVGDELKFIKFMTAVAARTSQMLNLTSIATEVGISVPTADRWLSILISSNIVYLLKPYYNNITKRAVKTSKLYFLDTGLAAYLTKWNTANVLENGAMSGAFSKPCYIRNSKSYYNAGILEPSIYYYRNNDGKEVDILIEENGILYPLEIKKTATPSKEHISNFVALSAIKNMKIASGGIICMYDKMISINEEHKIIPIWFI